MEIEGLLKLISTQEHENINIWEGVYETFIKAKADATGPGFNGDDYLSRSLAVATECLESVRDGQPIPHFYKQRSNLLPPIVALLEKKTVRILDFGGGLGIGYLTLQESLPYATKSIQYTIVELPGTCKLGEAIHSGAGITYLTSLPVGSTFDVVHAASSLQYIENWKQWSSAITMMKPRYILLSDVFAGRINSYVSLQNYYGSKIPHWFLNLADLLDTFDSFGYKLIMKSYVSARRLNQFDTLPMSNFPEALRLTESLHLLFILK